jgi:transcriptional regulator with XRE-family HTH domain
MQTRGLHTTIPHLIKRIRIEKSLSQEDLAHLADLDRTYISGIERGTRNITISSLEKVIKALQLDVEKFAAELIYQSKKDQE